MLDNGFKHAEGKAVRKQYDYFKNGGGHSSTRLSRPSFWLPDDDLSRLKASRAWAVVETLLAQSPQEARREAREQ